MAEDKSLKLGLMAIRKCSKHPAMFVVPGTEAADDKHAMPKNATHVHVNGGREGPTYSACDGRVTTRTVRG